MYGKCSLFIYLFLLIYFVDQALSGLHSKSFKVTMHAAATLLVHAVTQHNIHPWSREAEERNSGRCDFKRVIIYLSLSLEPQQSVQVVAVIQKLPRGGDIEISIA